MPELPEVETIRRQLEPLTRGRTITRVEVSDPSAVSPLSPASFRRALKNRRIDAVSRRGKYLCFTLDDGCTLVIHLRMTGRLIHRSRRPAGEARRHLRLLFRLDDGSWLAFHDQRRFGKSFILSKDEAGSYWKKLGPEPLGRSFTPERLAQAFRGRTAPVKPLLMDQSLVAGIGNIYADESLFEAGIDPRRQAGALGKNEVERLYDCVRKTLRRAIRLGGSSIDTYVDTRGRQGGFQDTFLVHRRAGEPCPRCGAAIEKTRVGGRGTYFCTRCQR